MNKKRWIAIVFILSILLVTTFYSFRFRSDSLPESDYHTQIKLSGLSPDIKSSIISINEKAKRFHKGTKFFFNIWQKNKISEKMPLVVQVVYEDGSKKRMMTGMPGSFIGLTKVELDSILEDWEIERYNPGKLLVLENIREYALPEGYSIGIKDDKVAIFYGRECQQLKQLTEINVEDLPLEERVLLKRGIKITDEEELLSILEGLRSINE